MGATRASLIQGVGRAVRGSYTSQAETEFSISLREKLSPVKLNGGSIDTRIIEYLAELILQGDGRMTAAALTLFWNSFASLAPGASLFGASDTPLLVHGSDGALHTLIASAVTKMPSIILHPEKAAVGPVTFTGILGTGLDFDDANSFYNIATGATYDDAGFLPADVLRQQYTAAWSGKTGFTAFEMQDGWTIDFNLTANPVMVQGVTRDFKFVNLEVMARGIPVGPTTAQINDAMKLTGTGALVGRSAHANAAELTITGVSDSAIHVTIPKAMLINATHTFSGEKLRNGEVAFYACRSFTAGVPQALFTIA
jgi:hypothetical protein